MSNHFLPRNRNFLVIHGLIILLVLAALIPGQNRAVQADPPDFQVFLPLVMKSDPVICPDGADQWLCLLNYYRQIAGLNPVSPNSNYTSDLSKHITYMLHNPNQEDMHTEYQDKPYYSEAGKTAANQSNMMRLIGATYLTTRQSIDIWMQTPNHRYHMLHPDLSQSGFKLGCDTTNCFSGLNVLGSLPRSYEIHYNNFVYPVNGQQKIPAIKYPISWGFYMPWTGIETDFDEVKFVSGKITGPNNTNVPFSVSEPVRNDGKWTYHNQVVLTPSNNLLPNTTYTVELEVTYQNKTYSKTWSFTTGPSQ